MRKALQHLLRRTVRLCYPLMIVYWAFWSKIYRLIQDRQYAYVALFSALSPAEAQSYMRTLPWVSDGWRELFDACGSPRKFQYALNMRVHSQVLVDMARDCDDYSAWAASVVAPAYNPRIVTVCYATDGSLAPNGHVVCAVDEGDATLHIGNWGRSSMYPLGDIRALASDVARKANATLLAYAVLDKNLRVLSVVRV